MREHFGRAPDGADVERVTIRGGGLEAKIISWGATLQDLRLEGVDHPLVLGSEDLSAYLGTMLYFGALVGRVSNRIDRGEAELDGERVVLDRNEPFATLHGGPFGAGEKNWRFTHVGEDRVSLTLRMPDGEGGFPGNLDVTAHMAVGPDGLSLDVEAVTDAPTFCAFAHHTYWNLSGEETIDDHLMTIPAESYHPVDDHQIPLGPAEPVAGTRFDFRTGRPVHRTGDAVLDHNLCPAGQGLRHVCALEAGGLRLDITSDMPGLQVYEGVLVDTAPHRGLTGEAYGPRAGLALEPQMYPDSPNQPAYPPVTLRPGETWRQRARFRVSRA
ncbi:aldose epimerase family protein [Pseudoroseicyclus tamaricis]|uniref:Galactose mutarotase n=1 Tax=Pseudoroseicyclus tamaricis TaxID=2705421 RepID=A0A6B2JYB2_9RHOB|nr:aldose epimerase family protein [Pseudoroseicyclus tamaricis]NDV01284.1 galactose mutarotase [Pseudoroseicyclus tamaricis]